MSYYERTNREIKELTVPEVDGTSAPWTPLEDVTPIPR